MTLSEFKAWFEGFTENIDGIPSKKQWARIRKRVNEISDTPTPFFVERYLRPYYPYQSNWVLCDSGKTAAVVTNSTLPQNSTACYTALGQADALEVEA